MARTKACVANRVPSPPTGIKEELNGTGTLSSKGMDFLQGSRAKAKQWQDGVVLGRRGAGRTALVTGVVADTGDLHQEWLKKIPEPSGGSGLIWLDRGNPELEHLLLGGVRMGS